MRLQFRLILLLVLVSIVPFTILGYYTYDLSAKSMERHATIHLTSVADTRADYLDSWLSQRLGDTRVVAGTKSVVDNMRTLRTADPWGMEYQHAKSELEAYGYLVKSEYGAFDEIFVLDTNGTIIASTDKTHIGDDKSTREYYREGLIDTCMTNVYVSPVLRIPTMLVSTPISYNNQTIGVLVGRINMSTIYSTVCDRRGLGETGNVFLIDEDGRLLSSISGSMDLDAIVYCGAGRDYTGIYVHDGEVVIGSHVWMPEPGWYLIVEQDHDEILSALHTLLTRAIAVTFGVIIVIVFFSILATKQIIKPIRQLYDGANAVAAGDYSVQVPVVTDDEIGRLTSRFNKMASELGETHKKLENQIDLVNRDLERERRKLESVLQSMPDPLFAIDSDMKIMMFNRACEEFTGVAADDAIGRLCHDVVIGDTCEGRCPLRESIDSCAEGVCWEMHVTDSSGRSIPIMTCGAPMRDADGNITGYVEVWRDVTELKQAADAMKKANVKLAIANKELKELDKLKTDFMNIASHELRTPLTSIRGFAEFVADGALGELNEKQKDALSKVVSNSDRLLRLINNLLDMSKIRSGKLELNLTELSISALIADVVSDIQLLSEERGVTCIVDVPEGVTITGDRDRIEQVLVNLVNNAIKFTPKGGTVSISLVEYDDCVRIYVRDTGIGISPDDLAHIFEEFWQVEKSKGTGLGLMISANIVREHGGAIWATSNVGAGSTFGFMLPKAVEL
ncbi:MAG TPA: sensor histidine kinase [Methanosarcinales archaeon]|nr:sensor histidine kinase [Methanosarcinales archaeon]